jgi:hypothetical protein
MFWRRKNARLENRLSNVMETSERTRQSQENRPRRVVVDTSYLAQPGAGDANPGHEHDELAANATDVSDRALGSDDDAGYDDIEPVAADGDQDEHLSESGEDAFRRAEADPMSVDEQQELEALFAAAEQCELALQREAEARDEAEAQRKLAEELKSILEREQVARLEAERRHAEAARTIAEAQAELVALRAGGAVAGSRDPDSNFADLTIANARLSADLARERRARSEIEASQADATRLLADVRAELEQLRSSDPQRLVSDAGLRDGDNDLAQTVARLEVELLREQAARCEAVALHDEADHIVADLRREIETLRQSLEAREQTARREAEAKLKVLTARFEAEALREQAAKREIDLQRTAAQSRATDAETALTNLRATAAEQQREAESQSQKLREVTERKLAAAHAQLDALRATTAEQQMLAQQQMQALRDELEHKLAKATDTYDALRASAAQQQQDAERRLQEIRDKASQRDAEVETLLAELTKEGDSRAAELERKLTEERTAAEQRLEQRTRDILAELSALRSVATAHHDSVLRLEAAVAEEKAGRRKAEGEYEAARQRGSELDRELAATRDAQTADKIAREQLEAALESATAVHQERLTALRAAEDRAVAAEHELAALQAVRSSDETEAKAARRSTESKLSKADADLAELRDAHAIISQSVERLHAELRQEKLARQAAETAKAQSDLQIADLEQELAARSARSPAMPAHAIQHHPEAVVMRADGDTSTEPAAPIAMSAIAVERQSAQHDDAAYDEAVLPMAAVTDEFAVSARSDTIDTATVEDAVLDETDDNASSDASNEAWDQRTDAAQESSATDIERETGADAAVVPDLSSYPIARDRQIVPSATVAVPEPAPTAQALPERVQSLIQSPRERPIATPVVAKSNLETSDKRRDRRVASHMPAQLSGGNLNSTLACTIRDRSSSGAQLEFPPNKMGDEYFKVVPGEKLTLTFASSQERTSVACVVVRLSGQRCGVQFCGQFHTQVIKPRRPLQASGASGGARPGKPKFGADSAAKAPAKRGLLGLFKE